MKDFLGNDVNVGDTVVMVAPGYRSLVLGRIFKMTPKNVRIGYLNTWNYGPEGYYQEVIQHPSQVTRVGGPEASPKLDDHITEYFY